MTHQLAEILAAPDLTPAKKLILWYVGTCPTVPKRREIAAALGLSIHTVDRYVTQLRRAGLWPVPGTYVPDAGTSVPASTALPGTSVPGDLESRLARLETLATRQAKWNRGAAKRIEALQRSGTSVPTTPDADPGVDGATDDETGTTVPDPGTRVPATGTHVPDDEELDGWDEFEALSIVCQLLDQRCVTVPPTMTIARYVDRAHARRPDLDPVEVAERVAAYIEKRSAPGQSAPN